MIVRKGENDQLVMEVNPYSKKPISKSFYYKKLGEMTKKTKERGQQIAKSYMTDVLNEHDTLISDRIELKEMMQKAEKADKIQTAIVAKREQIDLGRRILSVKELIKTLMEDPELEDEDQIERQIQLLTNS